FCRRSKSSEPSMQIDHWTSLDLLFPLTFQTWKVFGYLFKPETSSTFCCFSSS
ncbi:hypothetical protein Droror1_Dr00016327, partial [Drosera rotundifolia]